VEPAFGYGDGGGGGTGLRERGQRGTEDAPSQREQRGFAGGVAAGPTR
jgi:hypothetical protein